MLPSSSWRNFVTMIGPCVWLERHSHLFSNISYQCIFLRTIRRLLTYMNTVSCLFPVGYHAVYLNVRRLLTLRRPKGILRGLFQEVLLKEAYDFDVLRNRYGVCSAFWWVNTSPLPSHNVILSESQCFI